MYDLVVIRRTSNQIKVVELKHKNKQFLKSTENKQFKVIYQCR